MHNLEARLSQPTLVGDSIESKVQKPSFFRRMGATVKYIALVGLAYATLTVAAGRAKATVYYVPDHFSTVQAAISDPAVVAGDEIIVRDGTYTNNGNRDIDFLGKAITLRSENGPENCIIDCQGTETEPHRGFYFHSFEDASSVVEGFTITNGYGAGEHSTNNGGAILCHYSSSPTISNCIISGNESAGDGGGIHCQLSDPMVINCMIIENHANSRGGGVSFGDGGGGEYISCTISNNTADFHGGGVSAGFYDSPKFFNCVISNNKADENGGGLYCSLSIADIINCTISSNTTETGKGGGVYYKDSNDVKIYNSILWGNTAATGGPEIAVIGTWDIEPTEVRVSYSDVQGGEGMVYQEGPYATLIWDDGNIDTDPCFADPCNGDYHLKSQAGRWDPVSQSWVQDGVTSPCVDAGNPGCPLGAESNDGNNVRRNMGAYGGTAEASKSPANWAILADLTNDHKVDINDLEAFVGYWLDSGECIPSDLNRNKFVDFNDFAIFASDRLEEGGKNAHLINECDNWQVLHPEWIFCDDFESDTPLMRMGRYFEYNDDDGDFIRIDGAGLADSNGMRVLFQAGEVAAGTLHLGFGRVPSGYFDKGIRNTEDFREIYYRMYLKMQDGWQGNPLKLSRAFVFVPHDWCAAATAFNWQRHQNNPCLAIEALRCVDINDEPICGYHDDCQWLGYMDGITPIFDSEHDDGWFCVEHHIKLNDPGMSNGVQEFWIDGQLEARLDGLDFVRSYTDYAINAVFFENYWNSGSPQIQERYFDNIVVSTEPIGCGN